MPLAFLALDPGLTSFEVLMRTDINSVMLVIKIGTLVDEVELRDGEISFTPLPPALLWV